METLKKAKYAGIVLGIIVIIALLNPFVIIPAGTRGVVLNWGAVSGTALEEGLHLRAPIMQQVVKMDVQTQKMESEVLAYSKDIQTVDATLALNYSIKPAMVTALWQEVGESFSARIIDPAVQESVKSVTARFTAQELIEQRTKVKDEVKIELNTRLSNYFNIVEFSIVDFSFSDEYERAIEAKQVSQQTALKAENDLKRIEIEAEQRIAQAKAEAEAIRIQAESISKQGGAEYVQMQAIDKWNGVLPVYMLKDSMPFINIR